MAQLLPDDINDPAIEEPISDPVTEYGSAWQFHMSPECTCTDPLLNVPHLAVRGNKVMFVREEDTIEQWIRMTLATDRYRWEIYDNQYGTEFVQLIEASVPEEEAETEVIRTIRDAILVDPRISSVTSVAVTQGRDVGNPAAFIAEVRVVTYTGELRLLQLDISDVRTLDAYFNS